MSGIAASAENLATALYESLPFPVLVLDAGDCLVSRNPAADRLFGWERDDAPLGGSVCAGEHFVRADGSLFEAAARVVALDGGFHALLLDDMAGVEAQALELKKKNEALDQFTATVSHDLKAPLRHLSMFAEMISEDIDQGRLDDVPDYAAHMRRSAAQMKRIIESLLDYAQIGYHIVRFRPVPLTDVVRDALSWLEDGAAEIEVGSLPQVCGDPELLRRLAQNLIGNAIKYRHPDRPQRVRVYGRAQAQGVDFIVEDEGIGIAPQHAERIFDVFYRAHRNEQVYQGTGVGLALARRIAESHNGTIALDADYGPGARFVVTFPACAGKD